MAAESSQPAIGPGGARPDHHHVSPADLQTYQQERASLKAMLAKRTSLKKKLAEIETSIANHETEYLEGTPSGNIITGFDNYTKGTTSAAAQRRRTGLIDQNRVFSRSSISYNALNQPEGSEATSSTSTPGAPTPLSTTFANKDKDGGSNQPTPTSATTDKKGPGGGGGSKKKKARASAAAAGADEESETDTPRETKKVRTNFGARK
ncbi:hypothetical protein SLS62_008520 [Diatrype stigma]|uniref:Chromatin modification-related protein EAF6 n=1 Tax=Diatrype stigma TaxID=117547 RepID=A0AAN9UKZ9_9PEZI